jgi:hypothetical protein
MEIAMRDPSTVLDRDDPGDDTQLRFRYQHGYGVILLCAAATGQLPYIAIWCENHEDLLGEKLGRRFDSFQIKTAKPETGAWRTTDEGFGKSIRRFVELDLEFPGRFDSHNFVSNAECYDTEQAKEVGRSPVKFLRAVAEAGVLVRLKSPFSETLEALALKLGCDSADLFASCGRVRIVKGPPLDGFEASIAHEHLPRLEGCAALAPNELDGLRDELMQRVFNASSLRVTDRSRHWYSVLDEDQRDPRLRAKRLVVQDALQGAIGNRRLIFRFAPSSAELRLGDGEGALGVLEKKLIKGGLVNQIDTMQSRTLSAEQHLLTLVAQDEERAQLILNQLRQVVQAACNDAEAIASAYPEPWGLEMYRKVLTRLQTLADQEPDLVYRQQYDCLMGMAGLLTEACEVWWSPRFDLADAI